MKTGETKELHI